MLRGPTARIRTRDLPGGRSRVSHRASTPQSSPPGGERRAEPLALGLGGTLPGPTGAEKRDRLPQGRLPRAVPPQACRAPRPNPKRGMTSEGLRRPPPGGSAKVWAMLRTLINPPRSSGGPTRKQAAKAATASSIIVIQPGQMSRPPRFNRGFPGFTEPIHVIVGVQQCVDCDRFLRFPA